MSAVVVVVPALIAVTMEASVAKHALTNVMTAVAIAIAPAWSSVKNVPSEHFQSVEKDEPTVLAATATLVILLWLSRSVEMGCPS